MEKKNILWIILARFIVAMVIGIVMLIGFILCECIEMECRPLTMHVYVKFNIVYIYIYTCGPSLALLLYNIYVCVYDRYSKHGINSGGSTSAGEKNKKNSNKKKIEMKKPEVLRCVLMKERKDQTSGRFFSTR